MIILLILLLLIVGGYGFLQSPIFGSMPAGERLDGIKKSSNYKNGTFQNLSPTPQLTEGVSMYSVLKKFLFEKNERARPKETIPSQKTNLLQLDPGENLLVWFGHSSYFMQLDGKTILVDPVFSGSASPIATTKSFKGSDVYSVDDFPAIDYLFISHDHYDHLDYITIKKLWSKIGKVITGLGTGAHFDRWGYDQTIIIEKDWNEEILLDPGFIVHTTPGRHFSGRNFSRNKAIWTSFVLTTPTLKIFIGGDSGYDSHFEKIGRAHGPFDLAILECGQYDKSWKYIHLLPEQVLQAAEDLHAKRLLPVHWGKFQLANHAWDDPIRLLTEFNREKKIPLVTPMIGEAVYLTNDQQVFTEWWKGLK